MDREVHLQQQQQLYQQSQFSQAAHNALGSPNSASQEDAHNPNGINQEGHFNYGENDNDSYCDEERDQEIQNQINAFMNMRNFLHEKLQNPDRPLNGSENTSSEF